jgi:acyl carrier protein
VTKNVSTTMGETVSDTTAYEDRAPIAPSTPTEALVASVWCELLEVREVAVNDNFFEIGGHSLMATQAVFQLADRTGTFLELEAFFDLGTVAGIAAEIDRLRAVDGLSPVGATAPAGSADLSVYEEEL